MPPLSQVSGLVTGLDTSSIISQLMAAERAPVRLLESRMAKFDARVASWNDLKAKYAALNTAVKALSTRSKISAFTATSSNTDVVTASASSSASPGPVTFQVNKLAAAHQLSSANGFAASDTVVGQGTATIAAGLAEVGATAVQATGDFTSGTHTITVTNNGGQWEAQLGDDTPVAFSPSSTVTLNGTSGSIDVTFGASPVEGEFKVTVAHTADANSTVTDLAKAINTAAGGKVVGAQVINLGSGAEPYKVVLSAQETGTAKQLTVDLQNLAGFGSGWDTLRAADDAEIVLGSGASQLTVTRGSNTIQDVITGVTLNLQKADPGNDVTVTVDVDEDAMVAKIKDAVTKLNDLIGSFKKHTRYNGEGKASGALMGDATARALLGDLRTAVGEKAATGTYQALSQLGIVAKTDGTYDLDESKLKDALADDYENAAQALVDLTETLRDTVAAADGAAGRVATAKDGAQAQVDGFKERIEAYDVRLATREANYRRQFANLEVVLAQMQAQSSWLSAQVAGMLR